ncbi:MAG TPA: lipoate--protein ligase family protein [Terriglobia bacterium]|nr:lipoate--protein ligase family protein [Terriglobia bacterium]
MTSWKLFVDGPLSGALNMSIDDRLLQEAEGSSDPITMVRLYQWERPTVSLGRNQKPEAAVDLEFCRNQGIDIVHRPTGGRAVLHEDELTYAIVSNDTSLFGEGVYANYKRIAEALAGGLNRVGAAAALVPETRHATRMPDGLDPPCFLSPSRYELTIAGRKVAGSAQRRLRRSFLQHGSIPLTCDRDKLARVTRMADPSPLYQEMAGLNEFLSMPVTASALVEALVSSFQSCFEIEFRL